MKVQNVSIIIYKTNIDALKEEKRLKSIGYSNVLIHEVIGTISWDDFTTAPTNSIDANTLPAWLVIGVR